MSLYDLLWRVVEAAGRQYGFDPRGAAVHINYGESDDYMDGFCRGDDDRAAGQEREVALAVDCEIMTDPHSRAFCRGYHTGYAWEDA